VLLLHCRQGDPAASLFILISGRARLVRQEAPPRGGVRVEDEVLLQRTSTMSLVHKLGHSA